MKRSISLLDATALALGAIVGAGIFVVVGAAAGLAGPGVVLSIVVAGIVASFTAFSYVILSTNFPIEGGPYAYVEKVISPFAGFMTGWLWLFENVVAGATVSLGLAGYVDTFAPSLPIIPIAVAAILVVTLVTVVGVKQATVFNTLLVLLKLSVLGLFVTLGLFHLRLSLFHPLMPTGITGVLRGSALIFFAYIGFGRATTAAEETIDPTRTIPRSVVVSLALSGVIYLLVGFVAVGLIPYQQLAATNSPIADAAANGIKLVWLKSVVSFAAVAATTSVLLTTMIGVSRVAFAMGRDGSLPSVLSKVHAKFGTPYVAVLSAGAIMAVLPLLGGLRQVASVTNFGSLAVYAMVNIAAVVLIVRQRGSAVKRIAGLVGACSCLGLMAFLDAAAWLIGCAWLILGIVWYLSQRKNRKVKTEPS